MWVWAPVSAALTSPGLKTCWPPPVTTVSSLAVGEEVESAREMVSGAWESARPMPESRQFPTVYFAYDSSQVESAERSKCEQAAGFLKEHTAGNMIVEGHCDERGSAEYNLALGERRAQAVRAYLIGLGVDGARVQTKSYGEENPVAMGHDESSWKLNRRAEFVLVQ